MDLLLSRELNNLNLTIKELKHKLSEDPDPFLIDILDKLIIIESNRQEALVEKAIINERYRRYGGFKGMGVS